MSDYEYDESYDESDLESAFEDLEYDEARRRRRRRGRGRRGRRGPVPARVALPPPPSRREAEANRARDRQLAKAINTTSEEVSDVETRLAKVNSDVGRLKQLALISLVLPRSLDVKTQDVEIPGSPPTPVKVVTGVTSKTDIIPLVLFMSMARGIGTPGRAGAPGMGGDNMMLPLLLLVMQQQQQQQSQASGQTTTGGLDTTMLVILMMAMGGLS